MVGESFGLKSEMLLLLLHFSAFCLGWSWALGLGPWALMFLKAIFGPALWLSGCVLCVACGLRLTGCCVLLTLLHPATRYCELCEL